MSINRTSVKNNRRSNRQYNNPVRGTFYTAGNTDRYDIYYDSASVADWTIDIGDYIAIGHTNRDGTGEYGSVCYYLINKVTGIIGTVVVLKDIFDVESLIETKYLNGHLYLTYTRGNLSYTDVDLVAGTYTNYYNTEYTGSATTVNNDGIIIGGYLISSNLTFQTVSGFDYYKQWIKFISQ